MSTTLRINSNCGAEESAPPAIAPSIDAGRAVALNQSGGTHVHFPVAQVGDRPDAALRNTTASEMELIVAGLCSGYKRQENRTSQNPPPAPIKVPKLPTASPQQTSPSNSMANVVSKLPVLY